MMQLLLYASKAGLGVAIMGVYVALNFLLAAGLCRAVERYRRAPPPPARQA